MAYIKEIKKLGQRIEYESVFPPNALDGMEKAIREFDKVQKKEQGAIRIKDMLLFPAELLLLVVQLVQKMVLVGGYLNHLTLLEFLATF